MKEEIGTAIAQDGTVSEIYEIIKTYDKTEYGRVIEERADYAVLYHLADVRTNVIEWLPIESTDAVFEVNAECGALSSVLFRKAGSLTCLTDTTLQKELVEYRLKKEVPEAEGKERTVFAGNFKEQERKLGSYDWIILTGALGYAKEMLRAQGEQAYQELLERLGEHLKPEGTLVLIDNNRLGLKYLAGCQDDHYGDYFSGIQNYAGRDGYRTFTRKEYLALLEAAGMEAEEVYYPYPDYKFPMEIYSDAYLPKKGELNDNARNADRDRYVFFQETAAYNTLIGEGLFPEFSNSFLIAARKRGEK